MTMTRRDMCILLPALMATATSHAAAADTGKNNVLKSAIYNLKDLKPETSEGHEYIPIFEGTTSNGQHMTLQESFLGPGATVHGAYSHPGDEMFLVRDGMLEVEMEGKRSQVGPGGIAYVASNTVYSIRNSSKEWTHYFVFLFGPSHPHIQWK
jgi:mannose-6-phosphate isomerase-like protein (cupin superfamily)